MRRDVLWKVFHNLLANGVTRDATLKLLSQLLLHNKQRGQMHFKERQVMQDGMIFNILSTLQLLSQKVSRAYIKIFMLIICTQYFGEALGQISLLSLKQLSLHLDGSKWW